MMKIFLIRHGKTDANRMTRALFGKAGAPLNESGERAARMLNAELLRRGIDVAKEPAAVSEYLRVRQTAELAGFRDLYDNPLLNEIHTSDPANTGRLVAQGTVPIEATEAAKKLLADPPKQKVWFTHGLVIAAVLLELNASDPDNFVPDFCEIVEVEF